MSPLLRLDWRQMVEWELMYGKTLRAEYAHYVGLIQSYHS